MNNIVLNKSFKDVKQRNERFIILYGGAGSGKSYYTAQHILLDCIENTVKWCCIRKVARTLRNSVFELFNDLINEYNLNDYFNINKTDMTIECVNGSKIIMLGIDDPEKIKSIAGINSFWIEEASELDERDFNQINLRLRGITQHKKQIFLTFNPISSTHWLKKTFFDVIRDDSYIIKTTYKDNSKIDKEYATQLEAYKEIDEYYYNVYCLGEFGNLTGIIYNNWNVLETFPDGGETIYGLDFGFNNPSALVEIKIKDNEFYIKELFYESGLITTDLIEKIKSFNLKGFVYCDSAEPALIQELQLKGINAVSSNKDVMDGINFIKTLKLHVHHQSINVIKELNEYHWRKNKDGSPLDEPVKFNDHSLDAIRYAIYTHCKNYIIVPRITKDGVFYPEPSKQQSESSNPIVDVINKMRFNKIYGI